MPAQFTPTIFLLATLDTKGAEAQFLRERFTSFGLQSTIVDTGCIGQPAVPADISREEVFRSAGTTLAAMVQRADRGEAIGAAANGAANLLAKLYARGEVAGVIGIGGSAGTTIGSAAMRALPIGLPKVMVSTLASGQVRHYVGSKDIFMLNSIVDISGINRISRTVLDEAARALAGMVNLPAVPAPADDRPLIAATMFGVTTPCVEHAKKILTDAGYEVLVFHATGVGGQTMESLIDEGLIAGVLDITTTELADELVGGYLTAGPERLTAAGKRGIPQVVSVGAVDMVNFHAPETVPEKFKGRKLYRHNPSVTLMRTTPEENAAIGSDIGKKLAAAKGPTVLFFPKGGVSAYDAPGKPFPDPEARQRLLDSLRQNIGRVPIIEMDNNINDPAFAEAMARRLMEMLAARRK